MTEPLIDYMTTDDPIIRDAAFLRTFAERVRNGTAYMWEIPSTIAGTIEAIATRMEQRNKVKAHVSEIRENEDNTGALEGTDLFVTGRGISLLVNVSVGNRATYSLGVDRHEKQSGTIGGAE